MVRLKAEIEACLVPLDGPHQRSASTPVDSDTKPLGKRLTTEELCERKNQAKRNEGIDSFFNQFKDDSENDDAPKMPDVSEFFAFHSDTLDRHRHEHHFGFFAGYITRIVAYCFKDLQCYDELYNADIVLVNPTKGVGAPIELKTQAATESEPQQRKAVMQLLLYMVLLGSSKGIVLAPQRVCHVQLSPDTVHVNGKHQQQISGATNVRTQWRTHEQLDISHWFQAIEWLVGGKAITEDATTGTIREYSKVDIPAKLSEKARELFNELKKDHMSTRLRAPADDQSLAAIFEKGEEVAE